METYRKLSRTRSFLALLFIALLLILPLKSSLSTPDTTISVVNAKTGDNDFIFYTDSTISGDRFNATIWITDVTNLFAYQIYLSVNDTVLTITNAWLPMWNENWVFHGNATVGPPTVLHDANNNSLTEAIQIGDSLLRGQTAFSGNGISAIIEFEILQSPLYDAKLTSALNMTVADTYLLDSALYDIPSQKVNGNYEFHWRTLAKPWLEVSPGLIQYGPLPPSAVGEQFNIEVLIKGLNKGWNLEKANFTLNYDNTLVEMSEYELDPLWNESASGVVMFSPGILLVEVKKPAESPEGDVQTLQVTFKVKYQGFYPEIDETSLTLKNITLLGYASQEIPTEPPINGEVKIKGLPIPPWLEVLPQTTEIREVPPLAVGKQFTINITIKNLNVTWELTDLSFTLTYDQTLMKAIGVTEGSFMSSSAATEFKSTLIHDKVIINQRYLDIPQDFPQGEGIIASITFNITYQEQEPQVKEAPLNLTDIQLIDKNGNDIPENQTKSVHGLYRLKNLESSTISIDVNRDSVTVGSEVTISGHITPQQTNKTVTIYVRRINETWKAIQQTKTDSESYYFHTWRTEETGEFEIKAQWQGDENVSGNESIPAQLLIEPSSQLPQTALYAIIAVIIIMIAASTIYYFKIRKTK